MFLSWIFPLSLNRLCSGCDSHCHEVQRVHYVDSQVQEAVPRGGDGPGTGGDARGFVAAGYKLRLGGGSQGSAAALQLTVMSTVPQRTFALIPDPAKERIESTEICSVNRNLHIGTQYKTKLIG